MLALVIEHHEREGTLDIPFKATSADGLKYGAWLSRCKRARNKGTLDRVIEAELTRRGMNWNPR